MISISKSRGTSLSCKQTTGSQICRLSAHLRGKLAPPPVLPDPHANDSPADEDRRSFHGDRQTDRDRHGEREGGLRYRVS